jgi:hypothetical protein
LYGAQFEPASVVDVEWLRMTGQDHDRERQRGDHDQDEHHRDAIFDAKSRRGV